MHPHTGTKILSSMILNTTGLSLDIIGALLLLFFWVAPQTAFKGQLATIAEEYSVEDRKNLTCKKILARFGLVLIIVGFGLQLLSNLIP